MSRYALRGAASEEDKGAADSEGADPGLFLGGAHHYFNTNKPHTFFWQNTICSIKPQVISRGGGGGGGGAGCAPPAPSP